VIVDELFGCHSWRNDSANGAVINGEELQKKAWDSDLIPVDFIYEWMLGLRICLEVKGVHIG